MFIKKNLLISKTLSKMKQKSIIWSVLAIMMVAMLSVGFAACGSDDDDSGSGVVGTWSGKDGRDQLTLTFNSGGTGIYVSRYDDSYSGMETDTGSFTYTMEGSSKGVIMLRDYDSYSGYQTEILYFVIEGKTMSIYEDYYYDDLEWVLTKQ